MTDVEGMAAVILEHQRANIESCHCGWSKLGHSHPGHVSEMLTAAGYGSKADAWDEGNATGRSRTIRMMIDEPCLSITAPNPYRADEMEGK